MTLIKFEIGFIQEQGQEVHHSFKTLRIEVFN